MLWWVLVVFFLVELVELWKLILRLFYLKRFGIMMWLLGFLVLLLWCIMRWMLYLFGLRVLCGRGSLGLLVGLGLVEVWCCLCILVMFLVGLGSGVVVLEVEFGGVVIVFLSVLVVFKRLVVWCGNWCMVFLFLVVWRSFEVGWLFGWLLVFFFKDFRGMVGGLIIRFLSLVLGKGILILLCFLWKIFWVFFLVIVMDL